MPAFGALFAAVVAAFVYSSLWSLTGIGSMFGVALSMSLSAIAGAALGYFWRD